MQPLPKFRQVSEGLNFLVELVGMEIIHRRNGDIDGGAIVADRERKLQFERGQDVVQIVDVDATRFPRRQRRARLQFASIGAT